jgi:hypothetical protein
MLCNRPNGRSPPAHSQAGTLGKPNEGGRSFSSAAKCATSADNHLTIYLHILLGLWTAGALQYTHCPVRPHLFTLSGASCLLKSTEMFGVSRFIEKSENAKRAKFKSQIHLLKCTRWDFSRAHFGRKSLEMDVMVSN